METHGKECSPREKGREIQRSWALRSIIEECVTEDMLTSCLPPEQQSYLHPLFLLYCFCSEFYFHSKWGIQTYNALPHSDIRPTNHTH